MSDESEDEHPPSPKRQRKGKSSESAGLSADEIRTIVTETMCEVLRGKGKSPLTPASEGESSKSGKLGEKLGSRARAHARRSGLAVASCVSRAALV